MKTILGIVVTCCMTVLSTLSSGPGSSAYAQAAGHPPTNISHITIQQLATVLREEGFSQSPTDVPNAVLIKVESLKVFFLVPPAGDHIEALAVFTDRVTLDRMNAWNKKWMYSRAYQMDDGSSAIQLDLDLAGGVSKERLIDFIKTVKIAVLAFAMHLRATQ